MKCVGRFHINVCLFEVGYTRRFTSKNRRK
jgi:hypothetical protein